MFYVSLFYIAINPMPDINRQLGDAK